MDVNEELNFFKLNNRGGGVGLGGGGQGGCER